MPKMTFDAKTGEAKMEQPIGEFLISVPHLISASVTEENGMRIFKGEFAPKGTVEITTDVEKGSVSLNAQHCSVQHKDSSDKQYVICSVHPGKE